DGAHFRERLDGGESSARRNVRVGRRKAHTIPFFGFRIFGRKKQNFSGTVPGRVRLARLQSGKNDQAGSFLIVASEVVKIIFLSENVGLGKFFAAGESPENNWRIDLRGDASAARGVDFVGFAFAALLSECGVRRASDQ